MKFHTMGERTTLAGKFETFFYLLWKLVKILINLTYSLSNMYFDELFNFKCLVSDSKDRIHFNRGNLYIILLWLASVSQVPQVRS